MIRTVVVLAAGVAAAALTVNPPRPASFSTLNPGAAVTAFDIGAAPNPIGDGFSSTLSATVAGSAGVPDGSVDFYISSDSISCVYDSYNDLGTVALDGNGNATESYYTSQPGTLPICANYIPGASGIYSAAQAGVFLLTVYQPANLTVIAPGAAPAGGAVEFGFSLTIPSGQPAPTGTITLTDGSSGATLGTLNVANGAVPGTITSTLSGTTYYATYSGDGNYVSQQVDGQVFFENNLTSVTPSAVKAGAADTSVTLTGLNFTAGSQPQIVTQDGTVNLPVISVTAGNLQTTIPAEYLASPGAVTLQVVNSQSTGGPVQLQVYAPYTVTPTVTATPSTFTYGSAALSNFAVNLARGNATDAAVPGGEVSFSLSGGPSNVSLGSAQLSQVSSPGSYNSPFTEPFTEQSFPLGTDKLVTADLTGDGYQDVIGLPGGSAGEGSQYPYLQVMLSDGANGFQTEEQVYDGCDAQDFAVGDINGDGKPDLVVVCTNDAGQSSLGTGTLLAYYMLGNGDGTFQAPVAFGGNSYIDYPTNVVLGDFNGDGIMDIAVIDGYDGYVQVLFGSSPFGSFTYGPQISFDTAYGQVVSAGAADFDQDGKSDLALEEYSYNYQSSGGAVLVLLSQGMNGFTAGPQSETPFSASSYFLQSMAIADVNGDGYPDVAITDPGMAYSDSGGSGNVLVFENNGQGQLSNTATVAVAGAGAIAAPAFPVVGKPAAGFATAPWNLVVSGVGYDSDDYTVTELQRQDASTWNVVNSFDSGLSIDYTEGGPQPDDLVVGDFNGDGYLDFALNGEIGDGSANVLEPWFYGNDAQATLSGAAAVPVPGSYTLSVNYPGNQLFQANDTGSTPISIVAATPTGSVNAPASGSWGQTVELSATVAGVSGGAAPTGSVTFSDGGYPLATVPLTPGSGVSTAILKTAALSVGAHTLTASYGGDGNYTSVPQLGSAQTQIAPAAAALTLTSSPASIDAGTIAHFSVAISGAAIPAGEAVTLTGLPTSAAVTPTFNSSGVATYSFGLLTPGAYTIQAAYGGDDNLAPAASNTLTLQVGPAPVSVSLTPSASTVKYPTPINLTATASSGGLGVPGGSVDFQNSSSSIGSNPVTRANGTSGLDAVSTLAANGEQDIAVVTGDFNHDGNPDVAILQYDPSTTTTTLLVALGNGDGTFQTPVVYGASAGIDPASVAMAAADFNGDGYTDLVIVASDGNIVTMMAKGDAAGDLVLGQDLDTGTTSALRNGPSHYLARDLQSPLTGVFSVATGDFNHDGQQDFAVSYYSSVEVYFGNGGLFPASGSWRATYEGSDFTGIAAADFNHDGYTDLALSDDSGPDVMVLLYDSESGAFDQSQTYPVGASAGAIAAGDVNGDGYADLAVTSYSDSTVAVLLNNGSGGFGAPAVYGVAVQPAAVTIAYFANKLYGDVAVAGTGSGQGSGTSILLGSSTGAMGREAFLPSATGMALAAADFNGDGNPDLAIGNAGTAILLDSNAAASLTGVTLTAGVWPLTAAYSPSDSGLFAGAASSAVNVTVNPAASAIDWAAPAAVVYGTPLGDAQLDATATPPGGTFTYSPAAGTVLPVGRNQLSVTYTPQDAVDYLPSTATVNLVVQPNLVLTSSSPSSALAGSAATAVTLTGSGFTSGCFVELNGETIGSAYVSPTAMTAMLPASFLAEAGTGVLTVTNPDANYTTPGIDFQVTAAQVQVHLSGPATVSPGEQPSLTFTLLQPFPLDLQGTFTLTVAPATDGGPVDPAVQFSTGGDTLNFTIPANTTSTPTVQIQTGTLAATITVTLTLQANGQDVTPEGLQPVVITVPSTAPVISSVSVARSGNTLTVTVDGYSSTRDMTTAEFAFTAAAGAEPIGNPQVTVDVSSAFAAWYGESASNQYGSAFTYTQTFQLSNDASTVSSVSVTLTNSIGKSKTVSGQ